MEVDERDAITVSGNRWESKQKIERLFREGKALWYSDIAEILELDLKIVVDICRGLIKEGKIEDASKGETSG